MDTIAVDPYYTLIVATLVLLVGRLMVDRIKFLQDFNIPEPVAGGLVAGQRPEPGKVPIVQGVGR